MHWKIFINLWMNNWLMVSYVWLGKCPAFIKVQPQILNDSTWAVLMSASSFLLCLNFPDNPHHPGYCKSTYSSSISRVSSNKSGDLTRTQIQILMSPKAFCNYGSLKFVKCLWLVVSQVFHETLWVCLGRSVSSGKG